MLHSVILASSDHRTSFQQCLFGVLEVVVGPLHCVAQCSVARQAAAGADQQPEPPIEPITHLDRRHRRHRRAVARLRSPLHGVDQREPLTAELT
jgi:hypothetical protein